MGNKCSKIEDSKIPRHNQVVKINRMELNDLSEVKCEGCPAERFSNEDSQTKLRNTRCSEISKNLSSLISNIEVENEEDVISVSLEEVLLTCHFCDNKSDISDTEEQNENNFNQNTLGNRKILPFQGQDINVIRKQKEPFKDSFLKLQLK